MNIGKITLTEKELFEAVELWLKSKGLSVQVACVQKGLYHHHKEWEITSVVEEMAASSPPQVPALKESYRRTTCLENGCTEMSTNTGDNHQVNYCEKHKSYCSHVDCRSHVDCLKKVPFGHDLCDEHKHQKPVEEPL